MSNTRIVMLNLQHLIRLKRDGSSNRQIALYLGIHRNSVNSYVHFFDQCGQSYETLLTLSEASLHALFLATEPAHESSSRYTSLRSLFPYLSQELKKVGVTYERLWTDYRAQHSDGYGCSQFKTHLKAYLNQQNVSMVREHKWGESLFVDFSGKKLPVQDRLTGKIREQEVFIAVLGGSQYTYVEAVADQSLPSFLMVVQNALHYFGGVPRSIVSDNLKSAVTQADKYEAVLNRNFKALALHYQTVALPTRAYKPKDKALVEGAVKLMYQRIFYPLSNQTFFSLTDLNAAIRTELEAHNQKPFQGRIESRASLFQAHEKAELRPLPIERYELREYREGKVSKDTHVWFGPDKHYYSVPYRYVGMTTILVYTHQNIEIHLRSNHERIAIHARNKDKIGGFTTTKAHLPANIQFVKDWSLAQFEKQATEIGEPVVLYFQKVFETCEHPQQACTICMGILSLRKTFDAQRIIKACQRADHFQNYSYQTVKNILLQQLDQIPWVVEQAHENAVFDLPKDHPNIRGSAYYS